MASDLESLLAGCVYPTVSAQFALVDEIVCEYGRALTSLFLDRFATVLDQDCPGSVALFNLWCESEISFDSAWDTSLGNLRRAMVSKKADPTIAAASFAVHLCSNGVPGVWRAKFEEPRRVRWGNLLFPPSVEVGVSGGQDSFSLNLVHPTGQQLDLDLWRSKDGWQATHAQQLGHFRLDGHEVRLITGDTSDYMELLRPDGEPSHLSSDEIIGICRETVALMRRYAPCYLRWVDKVLRQVIPLKGGDTRLLSSSSSDFPGITEISFPSRIISTAEMLVHEASHQYFYILRRLEKVATGSDKRLYHSPVKGEERSIDKILLAFHAFGNVVLFYRRCIDAGLEDKGYCKTNEARHLAELEIMLEQLQSSDALTEMGTVLWKPLAAEIFPAH
jgi:hypothetical protein